MQTVLFKTSDPTAADGMVEFYTVSLSLRDLDLKISIVQEIHGWWNNDTRRAILDPEFSTPPEVFTSFGDAVDRYSAVTANRARTGFVHAFSWDGFVGHPKNYRLIDPAGGPRRRP